MASYCRIIYQKSFGPSVAIYIRMARVSCMIARLSLCLTASYSVTVIRTNWAKGLPHVCQLPVDLISNHPFRLRHASPDDLRFACWKICVPYLSFVQKYGLLVRPSHIYHSLVRGGLRSYVLLFNMLWRIRASAAFTAASIDHLESSRLDRTCLSS